MALHHTFGDSCMLREESNTFTRRASSVALDPPKITAQFFYCSSLPIDDPLAAIPAPSSTAATKSSRVPPRPFSVHDNLALDQAWLNLPKTSQLSIDATARRRASSGKRVLRREDSSSELYAASMPPNALKEEVNLSNSAQKRDDNDSSGKRAVRRSSLGTQAIKPENGSIASSEGATAGPQVQRNQEGRLPTAAITSQDYAGRQPLQETVPVSVEEIVHDEVESGLLKSRRSRSFFHRNEKEERASEDMASSRSTVRRLSRERHEGDESTSRMGRSPDTTGTPFLRVPARLRRSRSRSPSRGVQKVQVDGAGSPEKDYRPKQSSPLGVSPRFPRFSSSEESQDEDHAGSDGGFGDHRSSPSWQEKLGDAEITRVTVGISRLHVVELPSLKVRKLRNGKERMWLSRADVLCHRWDQYIGIPSTMYLQLCGELGSTRTQCGQ